MSKARKEAAKHIATEVGKAVAKPLIRRIGDKMENSKRPFWRWLVGVFRTPKENDDG